MSRGPRRRARGRAAIWVLAGAIGVGAAAGQQEVSSSAVREGHWLEVRGELRAGDVFEGKRAELKTPERHQLLIGTVTSYDRGRGRFELLGQPVSLSGSTEFQSLDPRALDGQRVEVEGDYEGPAEFEADEIEPQGEGSDRIGGRVDAVRTTPDGVVVRIMRYTVRLPPTVEHEGALDSILLAPAGDVSTSGATGFDEDDLFGPGIPLADGLSLAAQVTLESTAEENFDLDRGDAENRRDQNAAGRLRLQWQASRVLFGLAELRASELYREDEEEGSSTTDQVRLGEAFLYYRHPRAPFDVQVGRQDFDDEREWLYDQNLDGLRVITGLFPWRLELSATTTLSDGSDRDQDTTNFIGYLSRERAERHLAWYVVSRQIDDERPDRPTHLGFRLLGENGWLDLAWLTGEANGRDLASWGLDVGHTFEPEALGRGYVTVAYAVGSGDDGEGDGDDRTFRQTGLQDNTARFGGVSSFRYYGELLDPELANLRVATLGIGARVARRASLDLVVHHYRQDEARDELVASDLDEDPDGVNRELGWEVDLVYGNRRWESWDLELVGAYFSPGAAFSDQQDDAFLGKAQLRFRF